MCSISRKKVASIPFAEMGQNSGRKRTYVLLLAPRGNFPNESASENFFSQNLKKVLTMKNR